MPRFEAVLPRVTNLNLSCLASLRKGGSLEKSQGKNNTNKYSQVRNTMSICMENKTFKIYLIPST